MGNTSHLAELADRAAEVVDSCLLRLTAVASRVFPLPLRVSLARWDGGDPQLLNPRRDRARHLATSIPDWYMLDGDGGVLVRPEAAVDPIMVLEFVRRGVGDRETLVPAAQAVPIWFDRILTRSPQFDPELGRRLLDDTHARAVLVRLLDHHLSRRREAGASPADIMHELVAFREGLQGAGVAPDITVDICTAEPVSKQLGRCLSDIDPQLWDPEALSWAALQPEARKWWAMGIGDAIREDLDRRGPFVPDQSALKVIRLHEALEHHFGRDDAGSMHMWVIWPVGTAWGRHLCLSKRWDPLVVALLGSDRWTIESVASSLGYVVASRVAITDLAGESPGPQAGDHIAFLWKWAPDPSAAVSELDVMLQRLMIEGVPPEVVAHLGGRSVFVLGTHMQPDGSDGRVYSTPDVATRRHYHFSQRIWAFVPAPDPGGLHPFPSSNRGDRPVSGGDTPAIG